LQIRHAVFESEGIDACETGHVPVQFVERGAGLIVHGPAADQSLIELLDGPPMIGRELAPAVRPRA